VNASTLAAALRAERAYNAAADHYCAEPLAFWDRYGRRTITRLGLPAGAEVLDVCCGAGASALAAGRAVGPLGRVLAVDLAERLLDLGRSRARNENLPWVEFQRRDMTALFLPDASFDAVVCVFGIFFVPDIERQVAELWRLVRPGGRLAVTTWGPRMFAPGYDIWCEVVRGLRPDLVSSFNPWDRITTPDAVRSLFRDAGIADVEVQAEDGQQALRGPDEFWTIALGSGLRWAIDELGPQRAREARRAIVARLASKGVDRVETNVVYAVARKSG
jgi:SAM-dependent methyltransferase